jgi:GTP-binding protein
MFVDEISIEAKAGDGGNGVVRWRHEKFKPMAGPSGGNGGKGGDVYVRAVADVNQLSKYTGAKRFAAQNAEAGRSLSQHGRNGDDLFIDIPVGSKVTDTTRERTFEVTHVGEEVRILKGGAGGLGNEYFKSATNRSPSEATKGKQGEQGTFFIEVALMVDVGIIGLPNAGKSTLLNSLTRAHSRIGAYPFTTLEPHLGAFYEFTLADIPGLLAGAAEGKGLGHKFLRHVSRTKMLLHVVSLTESDVPGAYHTIRSELKKYDIGLTEKDEWIVLSKKDLVDKSYIEECLRNIDFIKNRVFVISENDSDSIKSLRDALVAHLRQSYNSKR